MTVEITSSDAETFTVVCMMVMFMMIIFLKALFQYYVRSSVAWCVMIDKLICKKGILIDAELDIGVDVVAGLDTNLCVATSTSLKFILVLPSLEETLLFGRGA